MKLILYIFFLLKLICVNILFKIHKIVCNSVAKFFFLILILTNKKKSWILVTGLLLLKIGNLESKLHGGI